MSKMLAVKSVMFLTSFGGTLCMSLFKQYNNFYYLALGVLVLIGGFSFLYKFGRKYSQQTVS